jgi:hypothetical protein
VNAPLRYQQQNDVEIEKYSEMTLVTTKVKCRPSVFRAGSQTDEKSVTFLSVGFSDISFECMSGRRGRAGSN